MSEPNQMMKNLQLPKIDRCHLIQGFFNAFPSLLPEQILAWHEFFQGALGQRVPRGVIHSCCGPCSLYPLKSLTPSMALICYYFNPNIHPIGEYRHRQHTQLEAIKALNADCDCFLIGLKIGPYQPADFFKVAKSFALEREGGQRCTACFRLRLNETAKTARYLKAHYFLSVMSVSSHKSSEQLAKVFNEIFLFERSIQPLIINFKKKGGLQKSRLLSNALQLYHQPYCGCIYSMPHR